MNEKWGVTPVSETSNMGLCENSGSNWEVPYFQRKPYRSKLVLMICRLGTMDIDSLGFCLVYPRSTLSMVYWAKCGHLHLELLIELLCPKWWMSMFFNAKNHQQKWCPRKSPSHGTLLRTRGYSTDQGRHHRKALVFSPFKSVFSCLPFNGFGKRFHWWNCPFSYI